MISWQVGPGIYLVVNILCELLSRMEGPLFAGIRGNGLAYGCSIGVSLWTGVMQLDIYRSSEPRKALIVFYDIIEYMATTQGWDDLCSDFHVDTARSMVAYNRVVSKSTAGGNISSVLRCSLRGQSEADQQEQEKLLSLINRDDLKRVFDKHFLKFLAEKE